MNFFSLVQIIEEQFNSNYLNAVESIIETDMAISRLIDYVCENVSSDVCISVIDDYINGTESSISWIRSGIILLNKIIATSQFKQTEENVNKLNKLIQSVCRLSFIPNYSAFLQISEISTLTHFTSIFCFFVVFLIVFFK